MKVLHGTQAGYRDTGSNLDGPQAGAKIESAPCLALRALDSAASKWSDVWRMLVLLLLYTRVQDPSTRTR
jgi:hypothetical protein